MAAIGLNRPLVALALGALALAVQAGVRAEPLPSAASETPEQALPDARLELPRISTLPAPVPSALLGLLPPGTRRPANGHGSAELRFPDGHRAVERVSSPIPIGDGSEWLEVEYTVDPDLDQRLRGVLERARISLGHVILMDPSTGEVFSYVSTDPVAFPPTRPYPTASLMKVVTAAALLRNAPRAASRDCRYVGSPWDLYAHQLEPPARGGRVASFRHAIAISNNQCFARYAVEDVGEEALFEEIQRVGFLEPPGAGHPPGRVLPVQDRFSLGQLGSGVAGSFITPLSAARLAAALAHGDLVHPYWIARVRDPDGSPLALPERLEPEPGWSSAVAEQLRELMVDVTERGTARSAFHEPNGRPLLGSVRVAGKTGTVTGRDPAGRYQWFIGVAPAETPSIAIATVVVSGPGRGHRAAHVAAAALAEVFCEDGRCDAERAERLHARAAMRETEIARELAEWTAEQERQISFARAKRTAAAHHVVDLDRPPRPIGVSGFDFPRRLRQSPAHGRIVLVLEISERGEVLDVEIASSDLPEFSDFVSREVRSWRFTPPTQAGRPVRARAKLPIPIHIN